jgi:hypothetical protein
MMKVMPVGDETDAYIPNDYVPTLGHRLEDQGVVEIVEAVRRRQTKFPDEPLEQTLPLILMNIGDRYVPLRCEGKEWRGYKKDILAKLKAGGDLTCPNGHALIKERGVVLGWVIDNR